MLPARDVRGLPRRLASIVEARLKRWGIADPAVDAELHAMNPVVVGPTIDRSVVGIMVDFAKAVPYHLEPGRWDDATLRLVEERLAETPCHAGRALDGVIFPEKKAPELLMAKWLANELRIRVARSRDTILGWTKSGHCGCYWSFNERRCVVRRRGVSLLSARGDEAGRRPSDERHSRIGTRRIPAQSLGEADGAAATRRARAHEQARLGEDTVMAHASVAERGRPPGSRSPFDTEDSAWAEDRRRPVQAAAGWTPARWAAVAER